MNTTKKLRQLDVTNELVARMRSVALEQHWVCFDEYAEAVARCDEPKPVDIAQLLLSAELLSLHPVDKLIKVSAFHGLTALITTEALIPSVGSNGLLGDWFITEYGAEFAAAHAETGEIGFLDSCVAGLLAVSWPEKATRNDLEFFTGVADATRERMTDSVVQSFALHPTFIGKVEKMNLALPTRVYALVAARELLPVFGYNDLDSPLVDVIQAIEESIYGQLPPCRAGGQRVRQLSGMMHKLRGIPSDDTAPVLARLAGMPPMANEPFAVYAFVYLQLLQTQATEGAYDEADVLITVTMHTVNATGETFTHADSESIVDALLDN